jgi:ATP-binding cassette subfamily B protein
VDRDAEQTAFDKACAYLNYNATAKWLAYLAAAGTGVVYVALLVVLWLFADLMVYRGRLPTYSELSPSQRARFLRQWDDMTREERQNLVQDVSDEMGWKDTKQAAQRADAKAENLTFEERDALWRAEVRHILYTRVNALAVEQVPLERGDWYADCGLLSLVVRDQASGSYLTWLHAWLARTNRWTWNGLKNWEQLRESGTAYRRPFFPPFLNGLLLIGLLLTLFGVVLVVVMREMAARATIEAATRLRRAVYHHTFRLGTLAFRALGPTEAVGVFTRHVESVHDALYTLLTVYVREPILIGLLILFALVVQPILALAFLLFAVLVWLIGGRMAAYFQGRVQQATHNASERLTVMRESLMMMRLVKCYLMEQFNQARVERQLSRYARVQRLRLRAEAAYLPLLICLGLVCSMVLLYVAGINVLQGQVEVASVAVLVTALLSLYRPVRHWVDARKLLQRGRDSAAQLFRFLERRGDVGQVVGAEFLPPLSKQIEFDNVSLREPGSNRMLLEEVSLTIAAGQRVGLVGPDDLEKHALVYLIPRLLDPTAGEIRIDKHNLRWVTLDSLRAQIAILLTHNLVFHDTVANNIGCGDAAYTLPRIIDAAKMAHAHHFIQKLPQGYDTPIGELGHSLSISEQYRIALARAILRDPSLLIIEEPEAALDDDTKALVDDTMTRLLPGRTAIFLPHRVSTIKSCDRIFLLNHGRIAASGQHRELLAQNPLYRHLHYLEFAEVAEPAGEERVTGGQRGEASR